MTQIAAKRQKKRFDEILSIYTESQCNTNETQ